MNKLIAFMKESFEVISVIKESKEDNGKIGLIEWVRIGRELADVIKLIPTVKDFPAELAEANDAQIQELVNEIYDRVSNLDRDVKEGIPFVDKADMVSLLKIIKETTAIVQRHK